MDNKDIFKEYSAKIDDVSLSVFIAENSGAEKRIISTEYPRILHSHSFVELFVCIGGSLTVISDFGTVTLEAEDIAIVPSNRLHATYSTDCHPLAMGICGVKIPKRRGEAFAVFSDLLTTDTARVYRGVRGIRDTAISLARDSYRDGSPIPVIKAAAIISDLAECEEYETLRVTPMASNAPQPSDIKPIIYVEEIINSSYCEPIDVEEIAKALYISRRHLDRIVRRHYGRTLIEMVNERRIKIAMQMLSRTDFSLEKIARAVGFSSVSSLRNAFARSVGLSLSEYRKEKRILKRGQKDSRYTFCGGRHGL